MVQELHADESRLIVVLIFSIIFLVLVSIGIILFFYFSRKKIIKKELEKADLKIAHQEKILQTSISIQETERKRIAQDLHDAISSKLNIISLSTNVLLSDKETNQKQRATLNQILDITSTTLDSSRKIAHDLLPPILDKFGLKAALEELFEEFSRNTDLIIAHELEELKLTRTSELHVFRIFQELINNSIRHGKASELNIKSENNSGEFKIIYEDNGKGFNVNLVKEKPGIGLQNIKSRVKILNGELIIESTLNDGSRFIIIGVNESKN
ncbi:MAG: sensor histidine kinase [Winogradskyella sp.]|uniref:sensor histidine kinase n=1 Tax=Winogradskyella sp. TaxID=1883156 RepID=UPI000F3B66D9|nr:histidine kinase [Winogradskyella sp.]RNC88398.1 MAG: sensor histidine kinase [Winogradskyella sp.]